MLAPVGPGQLSWQAAGSKNLPKGKTEGSQGGAQRNRKGIWGDLDGASTSDISTQPNFMDQDRLPEQDTSHPGRWMGVTQPRICERLEVGSWQRRLSRPRGKCPVIIMFKGTPPLPWVAAFPRYKQFVVTKITASGYPTPFLKKHKCKFLPSVLCNSILPCWEQYLLWTSVGSCQ